MIAIRCPQCHAPVATTDESAECNNGHSFPVDDGTINFLKALKPDVHIGELDHCCEAAGVGHRTEQFLMPWLRQRFGDGLSELALLEDGAGGGSQVQAFVDHGVDAYGIDPGHRSEQWKTLSIRGRLFIADGTDLPFPDETFDVVTSSGVLEHVGEPRPLPQREPFQIEYMQEALRVLKPGGVALIAHPNGAHPIDFWHPGRWPLRPHRPYEKWMPDPYQVRRWVRTSPIQSTIRFLPPGGYLAFETVRTHWYGRAFSGAMKGLFRVLTVAPPLAATWVNPWLIAEIRRDPA